MDRNRLLKILKEENYPSHMIENTLHKLNNLQPQTAAALEKWVEDGKTPTLNVFPSTCRLRQPSAQVR